MENKDLKCHRFKSDRQNFFFEIFDGRKIHENTPEAVFEHVSE